MPHPGNMVNIFVDSTSAFQSIDGFGVNINAKYWDEGRLIPALELLVDDLGATLFRVDVWGKSNWIDPTGKIGPASLDEHNLESIYRGDIFQRGWQMMRWMNSRGIQPYLTASGDVPAWMLGSDGKTLTDFADFSRMLASMVEWAKKREQIDLRLFGPLNETDLGSPEGPTVAPPDFVRVCEILVDELEIRGLDDIRLVVAEQSRFDDSYLRELAQSQKLSERIGAFGMHDYTGYSREAYQAVRQAVQSGLNPEIPLWMTEYGDLEQSGEREWYVAWVMTQRLFDHLENGFSASLVWDAFDNYHDHDEAWTIYGLLRAGLRLYTPKKRYYACKQVFRFVRPGFVRLAAESDSPGVRVLAFSDPAREQFTVVGINQSNLPAWLNVLLKGFPEEVLRGKVSYYRTSQDENCHTVDRLPASGMHWPFTGITARVPAASIFTLTTLNT